MSQVYVALQPIDHSGHGRVYQPGETFDLDHLEPLYVRRLVDMGAVSPVAEAAGESDESRVARATKAIKGG